MSRHLLFSIVLFLPLVALAQTQTIRLYEDVAVGMDDTRVQVFLPQQPAGPIAILWNGVERPILTDGSLPYFWARKQDLAQPGAVEITVLLTQTRQIIGTTYLLIGYDVPVLHMISHPTRPRIYFTTHTTSTQGRPTDPRFPQFAVVMMDLETGAIGPTFSPGGTLAGLTISEDGSALYLAAPQVGKVFRLNPETLAPISEFSLLPSLVPASLATIPGRPGSLVVHSHPNSIFVGSRVAIYDNGVKRPNELIFDYMPDQSLAVSPDGKYVFLSAADTGGRGLMRFTIAANGLLGPPAYSIYAVKEGRPIGFDRGLVYTSSGTVVDVESGDLMANLGGNTTWSGIWDAGNRRLLMSTDLSLRAYDGDTFAPLGQLVYRSFNPAVRFGKDGLVGYEYERLYIFHTPLAGPAPKTSAAGIVNAATSTGGAIAPGEILSLYGTNLGPTPFATASFRAGELLASSLANTQVWFDRTPAGMLLSSDGQLNVIAPFGMEPGSNVKVQVWRYGLPSTQVTMLVQSAQPGLFTRNGSGSGPVSVINQDGSVNTPSPPGSVVSLYGTGGGRSAGARDRELATAADSVFGQVQVSIGGKDAKVYYAGAAPSLPYGALQLNVEVPAGLASGSAVPVVVRINGFESRQGATLEIR